MCSGTANADTASDRELLPTNVTPLHYDLLLAPDLDALTFTGKVSIRLRVNEPSSTIALHAKDLDVTSASLASTLGLDATATATTIAISQEKEAVELSFRQALVASSEAVLTLEFTGVLNDLMLGFYRSRYTDSQGNTKNMASTHFEPVSARYAFPCFDEPLLKATFAITLRIRDDLTALSNMDVRETKQVGGGLKEVAFNTTPVMSTYLVAFVVGEFDYVEGHTSGEHNGRPIPCRVYTSPGKGEQGRFALDVMIKVLEYFADVFGIPYPLPKMDQIAINEFQIGAMENWGLITYREVALLVDEATTSSAAKQQVAYVVSHELAHQWFGNLVTMEWWSDLWLKEGFATWVGTLAVDQFFPEYHVWTDFVIDDYQRALNLDAMRSSHPIQVPVKRSSDISQIFDAISYSKGASAIRMLSSYIGLDSFFAGLRVYLQKHKYANAETVDLWNALSESSGQDVGQFMDLWTLTTGYPILTVSESDDRSQIVVRQSRYLSSGEAAADEDKTQWWVPLRITTSESADAPTNDVLTQRESAIALPSSGAEWYKLNKDTVGIYRVNYPAGAIANLAKAIAAGGQLSTSDRIGIIADAAALAASGHSRTSEFLTLLKACQNESEYLVWGEIAARFAKFQSAWATETADIQSQINAMCLQLFGSVIERLGWEMTEDGLANRLRALSVRMAGLAGDDKVVAEAHRRLNEYLAGNKQALGSDMLRPVLAVVVRTGTRSDYEKVKQFYLDASKTVDQRLAALSALGQTSDSELLDDALAFTLTDDVRRQDSHLIVFSVSGNPHGGDKVWAWFKDNYDTLYSRYSVSTRHLGSLVEFSTRHFIGADKAEEVEQFFASKTTATYSRSVEQTIETIKANTKWFETDRANVKQWFTQ